MKTLHKPKWKPLLLAGLATTLLTNTACGWYFENVAFAADSSASTSDSSSEENSSENRFSFGGGNENNTAPAFDNTLPINGGTYAGLFGGMSMGNVYNNFLVVNTGTVGGAVGGVSIYYGNGYFGDVYGNVVEINGGTVTNVSGGEVAYSYLTSSTAPTDFTNATGNVYNNEVHINGGSVTGGVIGGSALGGSAFNNRIFIRDCTIAGNIIGGYSISGRAYNNEVNISGTPDLSNANLIGGRVGSTASPSGNTLNINTWNLKAQSVDGFEFINFNNPQLSGTGLTLTGTANFYGSLYGGLENIHVGTSGDANIGEGSVLNLIQSDGGIMFNNLSGLAESSDLALSNNTYLTTMSRGVTFDYNLALSLSSDGRSLTGVVGRNLGPKEQTGVVSKAQIANVIPINTGTDTLVKGFDEFLGNNIAEDLDGYFVDPRDIGDGFRGRDDVSDRNGVGDRNNLDDKDGLGDRDGFDGKDGVYEGEESSTDQAQLPEEVREAHGFEIFGSIGYGKLRTNTGDGGRVKNETANFDLGLARTYDSPSGRWTIAPIFEHGKGNYNAYLSNGLKGYGDTKYTAGGLIARRINNAGFYFEASARFGRAKNDFASDDFLFQNQIVRATYHTSAPIFAGHIRVGQAKRLNRSNLLDMYAIYAYTRQGGSDTTLSTGDPYKFSSISSSRFRLGYRLTTRTSKISRIYTGIAYQYENTSDAETRSIDADGRSWVLPSSGSKGSSGMIEFGWLIKPRQNNPWLVDVNATGWFGHQKGATVMAKIKKSF